MADDDAGRDGDTAGGARPDRAWRAWSVGGVAAASLLGVLITRDGDGDGLALWLLGRFWVGYFGAVWGLLATVCALLAWWAWRHWTAAVVALAVAGAAAGLAFATSSPRMTRPLDPDAWFEEHRADFDAAVEAVDETCCEGYYGTPLPDGLRHVSVDGRVSGTPDGLFFAQWFGIPDDAGGYWYSGRSPLGNEMFGTFCQDPESMGGGWWKCGM